MRYSIQMIEYSIGSDSSVALVAASDQRTAMSMLEREVRANGNPRIKLRSISGTGFMQIEGA